MTYTFILDGFIYVLRAAPPCSDPAGRRRRARVPRRTVK
jgi:hypothetical protein